jgi:arylsulfatase
MPGADREAGRRGFGARPNILLIMTDQQRFDSLGCTGAGWVRTPNLDRLAADGVLFENCYATNPICTPSRASLMTGRELPGHGVYRLHDVLPAGQLMFPELLRERGYATALFGKLHVSGRVEEAARRHPHDGFDVYEWCLEPAIDLDSPFNGYARWLRERHPSFLRHLEAKRRHRGHDPLETSMNRWAADRTIDFLRSRAAEARGRGAHGGSRGAPRRPFFCMMSVFDPHNPYDNYPLEMERLVEAALIPAPVPAADDAPAAPWAFIAEREHSYLGPMASFAKDDITRMRLGYFAMVAHVDLEVGRVLAALEEEGLAEGTLVVFTSDHGDMLGDHATLVKGAMLHDPCVRVPLIARWPGVLDGGRRSAALVQPHDLAATFAAAAGVPDEQIAVLMPDARDLAAGGAGGYAEYHDAVVTAYRNSGIDDRGRNWNPPIHATMVRSGRFKLHVYHPVAGRQAATIYRLYDMERDPRELHDLSGDPGHRPVLEDLKDRLVSWLLGAENLHGSRGGEATPRPDQLVVNRIV